MMLVIFNGNSSITIIFCYSPTNISEETDLITLYNEISSFVLSIPKQNGLIIGGNMNALIHKDKNNKFCQLN